MRLEDYDIKLIVKSDKDVLNDKTLPLEIEDEKYAVKIFEAKNAIIEFGVFLPYSSLKDSDGPIERNLNEMMNLEIQKVDINELNSPEWNPRYMTYKEKEEFLELLKFEIKAGIYVSPITVKGQDMNIVSGNLTYHALKSLGWNEVDVLFINEPDLNRGIEKKPKDIDAFRIYFQYKRNGQSTNKFIQLAIQTTYAEINSSNKPIEKNLRNLIISTYKDEMERDPNLKNKFENVLENEKEKELRKEKNMKIVREKEKKIHEIEDEFDFYKPRDKSRYKIR